MKKKISSKKCIAIVLALVMVITSLPFMFVSALTTGAYDPAPYWGDAGDKHGAINTNFMATLNTDGSVSISFPNANAQKTYDGSADKTITQYVFTLTKLSEDGSRKEIYSEAFDASAVATGDTSAKYPNNIYYGPGGLASLPDYDVQSTYDVAIMAIDSDGWFSDKIHTLLSDTPYYDITVDFSPNETWVAREMLLFDGVGNAQIDGTSQGDGNDSVDYKVYSGSGVSVDTPMAGIGYDKTAGYRFWISDSPSFPYSVQTGWSRSHYNFSNAEEVWFYVDFSRVDITKVAFSLSANEKINTYWRDGTQDAESSQYGSLFSTKAVAGKNEGIITDGIFIQNKDGLWESTSMTDGYFTELSGYQGFIRIPIDYFLLQEDQFVTVDNTYTAGWSNSGYSGIDDYANSAVFLQSNASGWYVTQADGSLLEATTDDNYKLAQKETNFWGSGDWEDTYKAVYKLVINPAGTTVTDAVIIHSWFTVMSKGTFDGNSYRQLGYGLHKDATATITDNSDGTKTYTVDRENAPKAISDLISAGIEIAEASSRSKSLYIDQVMFCQHAEGATFNDDGSVASTSAVKFPEETGFAGDLGYKVANYYDRTVKVPEAIANYILEYVGEIPSLDDVNTIKQIDEIILTYINCFPGCSTVEQAIEYLKSNTIGQTEAYDRYKNAVTFIDTYVKLGEDERNYNAVVAFESGVELLPKPEFADYNDEELKTQLAELMALYKSFNLSHFEILGVEAEDKFTTLYSIMMGEEVKTGYSIGAYPYIPFNDFETNYTYGQLSELYYDDYPSREDSKATDVNSTKNFVTYVADSVIDQLGAVSGIARGWSPMDYRPTGETLGEEGANYFSRMDAIISNKGFDNSQGATIRLNGDLNSLGSNWKTATLSTTYLGQNVNNWSELKGLDLSALSVSTAIDTAAGSEAFDSQNIGRYGDGVKPNSFVMYVDFTDVTDICMNIKFIVEDASGNDDNCYFCGGAQDRNPIIYLLDEKGDWVEQKLEVTQTDLDANASFKKELRGELTPVICSISPSSTNSLEGYKGFIRIPLTNFRIRVLNGVSEDYLCLDDELENYTIKQAKITFWDETGANVGKEINIDAMGFTYDPACQTRTSTDVATELANDNGITVTNMDEYFGVKTNDSVTVEKMIAEIDPYVGEDQFIADCNAVLEAYANLSSYQKSLEEIDYAYNTLFYNKYYDLYMDYNTVINQEPWVAKYATATELLTDIGTLDSTATSFDITDTDNALTVPYNTTTGVIDYDTLGIADKAEAEAIVEMYEKGYMRLSGAEKANLSEDDLTKLENAYNAAKRLLLLEDYLVDINTFESEIIQIYTSGTAEPDAYMVSYENPVLLQALTDYENMSVFAKKMISETVDTANINYANMYVSAEAVYDNSHTITMSNGTTIDGGILVFENRMNTCAIDVGDKIDINTRTVLDAATLNEIEYCLGQTESFLPRYAHVDEINVAYHALADLLPVADIASVDSSDSELNTINITNETDGTSYTAYIDLSYIATRLNKNVDLYAQSTLKWTQTSGTAYDAFEDYMYNGVNAAGLADYQNADGVVTALVGSYTNGDSSSIEKYAYEISVDATEAANVPTGAVYSGKIEFYVVDPAVVAEKTADGTDISEVLADSANFLDVVTVDVVFESTNGADPMTYTVEIPAIVQVDWDDDSVQDVSYSVEANLGSNELSVGVAGDGTNTLVAENTDQTLTYTETNFKITTFTGTVAAGTKPADEPSITVTGWDAVAVGEYSTQLTYTVDVTSN